MESNSLLDQKIGFKTIPDFFGMMPMSISFPRGGLKRREPVVEEKERLFAERIAGFDAKTNRRHTPRPGNRKTLGNPELIAVER
jgi:hypothetical protein